MDAWALATPTAISDIPPFRESAMVYGIKTAFFNPLDPDNIYSVLQSCLSDYARCKEYAAFSKSQMDNFSDRQVASNYMDVFKQACGLTNV
jgi:hypothetical protein